MISPYHFANISVEISPNDKKFQDGISVPIGSREIKKNKSVYSIVGHPV